MSSPSGPHPWYGFIGLAALLLIGVIPGWLIFAVRAALAGPPKSWRGVLLFLLGCALGPCLVVGRLARVDEQSRAAELTALVHSGDPVVLLATALSVLTTLLYFVLVELGSRRRIQTK